MVNNGQAPRGVLAPQPIDSKNLFKMDIDHDIWDDVGLYDNETDEVPRWMSDEKVRSGIRALLQVRRCREELARLVREVKSLREWSYRSWSSTTRAYEDEGTNIEFDLYLLACLASDRSTRHEIHVTVPQRKAAELCHYLSESSEAYSLKLTCRIFPVGSNNTATTRLQR